MGRSVLRAVGLGVVAALAVSACSGAGERVSIERIETGLTDLERDFAVAGDAIVAIDLGEISDLDETALTSMDGRTWSPVDLPSVPAGIPTSLRGPFVRDGKVTVNGELIEPGSQGVFDPDFTTYVWSTTDGRTWRRTPCPRVLGCEPAPFNARRYYRERVSLDGGRTVEPQVRFGEIVELDSGDQLAVAATPGTDEREYAHLVRSTDGGRTWRTLLRDRCRTLAELDFVGWFRQPVRMGDHWVVAGGCSSSGSTLESAIYLGNADATTFRTISRSPDELRQPVVLDNRVLVPERLDLTWRFVVVSVD